MPNRFDLWVSSLYGIVRAAGPFELGRLRRFAALVAGEVEILRGDDEPAFSARVAMFRRTAAIADLVSSVERCAKGMALVAIAAERALGLEPHPVQFMGARTLLLGQVAEMATGEGKSLTAAMTAALAALAGEAVHVITVNDYLADRDAERHRPLFAYLGVSVDCVMPGQPPARKRRAYRADVTYCTNKDVVFDHLRDRIATGSGRSLRRRLLQSMLGTSDAVEAVVPALRFAIVDEADSVLIDEARTPLIISRDGDAERMSVYAEAVAFASQLEEDVDWQTEGTDRRVVLTEEGRERLDGLTREAGTVWHSERMREFLVIQALSALHLYQLDQDYIVRDGKVQIVDEYTGRVLSDRSWERGLHQMIEAKEGVDISPERESIARMTYQRFFRRYERLAGMTGTAREVAGELWAVYGMRVVAIPTHRPVRRDDLGVAVFKDEVERLRAIVASTLARVERGQAVLIGTRSVQKSEAISRFLDEAGVAHVVLNARQDADEADVVASAGQAGRVTVATNMAGRGTDIVLADSVRAAGGLHVILTEFHDSARIDRQLIGRGARQGDPGTHEALVCLDDDLFRRYADTGVALLSRLPVSPARWPAWLAKWLRWLAQTHAQRLHARIRMHTLRQDFKLQQMMGFAGKGE